MIKTSAAVHTLRLLLCLTPSNQRSPYIFCGHREPAKKHSKFRSLWNGCAARPEAPACGPGPPLPHPMEPGGGCGSVPNPDQCWCSVTTPPGKAGEGGEGLRAAAGHDRTKRKERVGGYQCLQQGPEQATDLREPPPAPGLWAASRRGWALSTELHFFFRYSATRLAPTSGFEPAMDYA